MIIYFTIWLKGGNLNSNFHESLIFACTCDQMKIISFQLYIAAYVQGFHVYQVIWTPVLGGVLNYTREMHNRSERFAVRNGETVVGHIPRDYYCISSLFLQ